MLIQKRSRPIVHKKHNIFSFFQQWATMMTILAFHPDQQVLKVASAISFRYKKQKQKKKIFLSMFYQKKINISVILNVWNIYANFSFQSYHLYIVSLPLYFHCKMAPSATEADTKDSSRSVFFCGMLVELSSVSSLTLTECTNFYHYSPT